ncbi:coiled-coil domain-containing protein 117 [Brachyhypopomus gauderio]|uniref:coiled-coil domain-containing protein 117 n=1 Tax=Brachyhypopomus gauderio TaxID=698409 RepID=UPI0040429F0A
MHSCSAGSSDVGYLPSVYATLPLMPVPNVGVSAPPSGSHHLPGSAMTNPSWERRCQRKHRRTDAEGCNAKRQKLMEVVGSEYACTKPHHAWSVEDVSCSTSAQPSPAALVPGRGAQDVGVAFPATPLAPPRLENEGCCMEVEAAQRKLQEIEDRITLEDDSDEDLDVEPMHRKPVLVLSDSLREGLQRGLGDILPHTVAQSVSRSCMELVLWRPPQDPVTQQRKDSFQRQQRKHPVCRQTPTPTPSTPPSEQPQPKESEQPFGALYCPLVAATTVEEDMEL